MRVSGVGFGVDVFVIEPSDKSYRARQLDEAEVREHADFVRAAEEAMRSVRETFTEPPEDSAPVPEPPTPEASAAPEQPPPPK